MKKFVNILHAHYAQLMRHKFVVCITAAGCTAAIGAGGVAFASSTGADGSTKPPSEASALSNTELTNIALDEARTAGDENPIELQTVDTDVLGGAMTIDPAAKVTPESATAMQQQWLYQKAVLEVLHGHFTLTNADLPSGASAPTGSVLSLVVATETGAIAFRALTNSGPSQQALEVLGTVSASTDPASSGQ
jgi:hypothetical protein